MIKIKIDNLSEIKELHKGYFDVVVRSNWQKVIINKNNKIDKKSIDFLKTFFYANDELNEKLMVDLCYGDGETLEKIIGKFEKEYKKYLDKTDLKKECLIILCEYEKKIEQNEINKENRLNKWNECMDNILAKLKCVENINKDELHEKYRLKIRTEKIKKNIKPEQYRIKNELKKYINQFKKNFYTENPKKILEEIFDYNKFSIKENKFKKGNESILWNRHKLLTLMNINVCPYCNRQFINSYYEDGNEKSSADIDHFYLKSEYPYLALSLYNFIPSCQICNSRLKNEEDFYKDKHIYPYKDDFGQECKFRTKFIGECDNENSTFKYEEYDIAYLLGNSDNFSIQVKAKDSESEKGKQIENSINTFKLNKLYEFHKDYVRELIKKSIIYNDTRVDELYNQYPELFKSRGEVLQLVVSNYIDYEDLGKRPLAKLTKDICEELGIK